MTPIKKKRRGIYFLPSLFTTASLSLGFFAIIQASQQQFGIAAISVLFSSIMDGIDGRVARWTNTVSEFGKEYDSLVDAVSFGVTPALMCYFMFYSTFGNTVAFFSFVYTAATLLRLARFNSLPNKDNRYFQGLSCPMAAIFMVLFLWNIENFNMKENYTLAILGLSVIFVLSLLQVSNIRFRSFKDFDVKKKVSFITPIIFLLIFALVELSPARVLFFFAAIYVFSGPVAWVYRFYKGKPVSPPSFLPDDEKTDL